MTSSVLDFSLRCAKCFSEREKPHYYRAFCKSGDRETTKIERFIPCHCGIEAVVDRLEHAFGLPEGLFSYEFGFSCVKKALPGKKRKKYMRARYHTTHSNEFRLVRADMRANLKRLREVVLYEPPVSIGASSLLREWLEAEDDGALGWVVVF